MSANWYHLQTCNHWSRVPEFLTPLPFAGGGHTKLGWYRSSRCLGSWGVFGVWLTWLNWSQMDVHKLHKDFRNFREPPNHVDRYEFVVCFISWSGGGQKGRNKYCKQVIGNVDNTVFLDDTVLAWIQWSLYLGLYGFKVVVGMAMSILHLMGIRIPMSIPHFLLVQGYGHGHRVVFMVNVRLRRSLHVWKHSGWVCVCIICPFASCKPSNMKQAIQIHPVHISPDLFPSSLVLPDVFFQNTAGFQSIFQK